MNSRVSVDAEREVRRAEEGGEEEEEAEDTTQDFEVPQPLGHDGQGGNIVLVLSPKDNIMAESSTDDDCIPIMVNDVPVYISHTSNGSPLYIRQYPPTLEEIMMTTPQDLIANFDGFSEAGGQAFEGFSEGSCSSVLFEGFSEDGLEPKFSVLHNLSEILTNSTSNDFDYQQSESESDYEEPSKTKSVSRRGQPSKKHTDRGTPRNVKRSNSSDTPSQRSVKQRRTSLDKSVTSKNRRYTSQASANMQSLSKRRQSTEKQEREPPEGSLLECVGKKPRHLPSPDDPDYIGERCNDIGCTVGFLERMAIKQVKICNGIIQELSDFASRISWDKEYVVRWIQRLNGVKSVEPLEDSDLKSIQCVLKRRKALATIHSGNQFIKSKLKSYDDIEFVLPSLAKRQDGETEDSLKSFGDVQSSDEVSSMVDEPDLITKLNPQITQENEQQLVPETNKTPVAAQIKKEQVRSERGVKRTANTKEDENNRHVKERRISIEASPSKEQNALHKTVEEKIAPEKAEENSSKEGKETPDKSGKNQSNRSRQMSLTVSEVEENKVNEKDEGQQAVKFEDNSTNRRIITRRSSMMLVKEGKEAQPVANETQQFVEKTTRDRKGNKRTSIILKQEEKRDDSDKQKENKITQREMKNQTKEGEEEPSDETVKETKTEPRTSSRRRSILQLPTDKKQEKLAKDNTNQTENEEQNQATTEIKMGKKIGTRRASMLARQEKERKKETAKSGKETGRDKRSVKSNLLTVKNEGEGEQASNKDKEIQNTDEQEKLAADKIKRTTKRDCKASSRRGSVLTNQEEDAIEEEKDKTRRRLSLIAKLMQEEENENTRTKKRLQTTDIDEIGGFVKRNRKSSSRKGSIMTNEGRGKEGNDATKPAREAKNVEIKKQKRNMKERETTNKEEGEYTTDKENNMITMEDKPTSGREIKEETERDQENKVNESVDIDENNIIMKRNKVIHRDKRISRWQNRRISKYEKKTISTKEEESLPVDVQPQQMMTNDDSDSDDSDGNLVIDEGDSMLSDQSEHDYHTEEGDSSMQGDANYSTPRKKMMSMSDSEVIVNEGKQKRNTRQMLDDRIDSSKDQTQVLKKEESEEVTAGDSGMTEGEESSENQDPTNKIASPQNATTPVTAEASPKPQGTGSSYDGTLGISKSGRLRKASAKGIQSIEIKCLFMQRNSEVHRPPPPLPALKNEGQDKDWIQEKRSPVKYERKNKDPVPERKSPVKQEHKEGGCSPEKKSPLIRVRKPFYRYRTAENQFRTYTQIDGHLVPKFKEINHHLGDFCSQAGITVADLNSSDEKRVKMTFGMIKELHDFYTSRTATKTALAIRLFKMVGRKILDNTHLLSTVIRVTSIASIRKTDMERLSREFVLPNRMTYCGPTSEEDDKSKNTLKQPKQELSSTSPGVNVTPSRVKRPRTKRVSKPEDAGEECCEYDDVEDDLSYIQLTHGEEGSITRGDIVHLYTKWLRNKMAVGSNTFVTDLLRSVEQLMAERSIPPMRIPAGTLMSSSVRLHDEYTQILRISREDAVMYLQEDWLEDITYLLSISAPSRRNTTEGEPIPAGPGEGFNTPVPVENHAKAKTIRRYSGGSKEENICDFKGEPLSNTLPFRNKSKTVFSRNHQMESVGKRQLKRRSLTKCLDDYDRDILLELEKAGGLEDEEEDILSQLDNDDDSEYEGKIKQEKRVEKKKERRSWGSVTKDKQKDVKPFKANVKPFSDSDFEVEKIVDYQEIHDSGGKHLRYLVRWIGFGPEDDSWVDENNLECPSILETFWKRKKKPGKNDKHQNQHYKSPKKTGYSKLTPVVKEPEESIIQAMVKHGSMQHTTNANMELSVITKRELLNLYDSWRQENQDDLIAGGSNTVNVEVFKSRVNDLMTSRNINFYPESLLNACFMMTLTKTRLRSKMAIDRFLDTSCLEVLESSHRQYMKRKNSQVKKVPATKCIEDQKRNVSNLQNELHSLKLDLTTAQKWRTVKNSQLSAVEEEMDCLETIVDMTNVKKSKKVTYFKEQLKKLKDDVKMLEKHQSNDSDSKNVEKVGVPLFDNTENYQRNNKIVRNKLMNLKLSKNTVNSILEVVARRVSSQFVQE